MGGKADGSSGNGSIIGDKAAIVRGTGIGGQSVGVIGAGIGGLTAAVYLAQAGYRVTVIEKAAYAGGSAGSYVRGGRTYPTGATIAYGLEPGGVLRELLADAGVTVPAKALSHAMDVVLRDRTVSVYAESGKWERELARAFPERATDVLRFWRELAAIAEQVLAVTRTRAAFPLNRLRQLGGLPRLILRRPLKLLRLIPHSMRTVEDLLRKHRLESYAPLRSFLDVQLIDAAQTDCTEAALLPAALALDIYRYGSFAVEGGFGGLIASLADRLNRLGGELLLRSPVTEMLYELGQWKLRSRNRSFDFDWIVNASGLEWNGSGLVEQGAGPPGTPAVAKGQAAQEGIRAVGEGWGAFRIDARVSAEMLDDLPAAQQSALRLAGLPFAWQIVPVLHKRWLPESAGPVYVTAHSASDASGKPIEVELLLTVSVHVRAEDWIGLDKADYRTAKSEMTEAIVEELVRVLPSFRDRLLGLEAGSPRTYRTFVGKSRVGGFPLTVRKAILRPRGSRGSHPRLVLAGEQVFPGPGTLSAALSGYYAARAVAGRLKQEAPDLPEPLG